MRREAVGGEAVGSVGERERDVKQKSHPFGVAFLRVDCLTMSYFHERLLTIIGATAFHGPVRDGKGWFHRAMVIRHDLLLCRAHGARARANSGEVIASVFLTGGPSGVPGRCDRG